MLTNGFENDRLDILAVHETHLSAYGTKILTSSSNEQYLLHYSGGENKSENGVGVILSPEVKVMSKPVNNRI